MTSGVSDISTQLATQYLLRVLRSDVNDTQRQINTGKKSTNVSGLGTLGASNAISFRNKANLLNAYTDNLNQASAKFKVMDSAMGTIADSARDIMTMLRTQMQDTVPQATIIRDNADTKLQNIYEKFNVQLNGRFLFSGDDIFNTPLSNTATLNANATAEMAGWLTGPTTTASVVADARAITGTALGFSASALAAGNISFRADDNTDIDYTVLANQPGFSDVLRGMAIIANLPAPTNATEQDNYWDVINAAIQLLDEGSKAIDGYQGELGNKAKLVDSLLSQHRETDTTFQEFIGTVEDADIADATIRFQSLQTQLQASYNVIAQLKDLSLINFL
jgi:flagellar hook-associated protein 3 FlgL